VLSMNSEPLPPIAVPSAGPAPDAASRLNRRLLDRRSLPLVCVALAGMALILSGHGLSSLLGALAGAGAGAFAVLRGVRGREARPPEPAVQRLTDEALAVLRDDGWHALHDVLGLDGRYDHVVVGPGGVILLQSIAARGTVMMHGGEPVVAENDADGRPHVRRLLPQAHNDALDLRDGIARCTGRRVWVQSVVVFWADFPAGCVVDGRCVFVHGSRLAEWMRRRPHQLTEPQVAGVLDDILSVAAQRDPLEALAV
jgi:hypothetical protein